MKRARTARAREEISTRTGIRVRSSFEPLYHAYAVDVYKSSPMDVMHFMSNIVKYVVGMQYDLDVRDYVLS